MKNLISLILILICSATYSQEATTGKSSFLTRNQPIELFPIQEMEADNAFKLKLPSQNSEQIFQTEFMALMPNNSILMNYPSGGFGENNNVVFGTFSISSLNLGKTKMQTFYFFNHNGRLTDTITSFSFGKKKRN